MSKVIVVEAKVIDEATGIVSKSFVRYYDGSYEWEIESLFEKLFLSVYAEVSSPTP